MDVPELIHAKLSYHAEKARPQSLSNQTVEIHVHILQVLKSGAWGGALAAQTVPDPLQIHNIEPYMGRT